MAKKGPIEPVTGPGRVAGIKKTMRNTPLNPQSNPPINETPPNRPQPFGNGLQLTKGSCNDKKSPLPIIMSQKHLKPANESTALAMKESHLFPT